MSKLSNKLKDSQKARKKAVSLTDKASYRMRRTQEAMSQAAKTVKSKNA